MTEAIVHPLKCCTKCGIEFPATTEFFRQSNKEPDGFARQCKSCVKAWEAQNRVEHGIPTRNKITPDGKKRCNVCEKLLSTDEFYANKGVLNPFCKVCARQKAREWRDQNLERARAKDRERYWANRDAISAQKRLKRSQYLETSRRWHATNQEHVRSHHRQWQRANPDKVQHRNRKRAARQRGLPNTYTLEQWNAALVYFDHRCAVCGRAESEQQTIVTDHWIPLADETCPGTVATNIVPLCHGVDGCNNKKSKKMPHEWLLSEFPRVYAEAVIDRIERYFDEVANGTLGC